MVRDALAEAIRHHEAGSLKKAEKLYKTVLKANPNHAGALNLLGVLNYQAGRHGKAVQLLEKSVSISPNDAYAQFNLGNVYKYRGKLADAERAFRKAVKLNPNDAGARANLGIVLQEGGRHDEARDVFESAVALAPGDPQAHFNLANALLALGAEEAARGAFEQAVARKPDFAEAHGSLGNIHLSLREYEAAEAALGRAVALKPDLAEAHANLGAVLNETGRFAEAVAALETAIGLDPGMAEAHNSLGSTLKNLHRFQDAEAAFRRALKLRPDFTEARINLAAALFRQEDLDGAVQALQSDADDLDAIRALADLWERANRPDEALPVAERGLALAPEDAELNLIAAKCARRAGALDTAIARLERIDRSAPGRSAISAAFELGRIHDERDECDKAFACFTEGNALSRAYPPHAGTDKNIFLDMVDALAGAMREDWVASWSATPPLGERAAPVFFFGFPRTGTTLIEQVLAGHPDIVTLDEQPAVDEMLGLLPGFPASYPSALADLGAGDIEAMRARYFATADAFLKGGASGKLLIDKMPLNIVHVAMIWRVFPGAKMILALRHPYDVCLSCFMQNFEIGPAMANFFTLEDAAHLYAKVMTLWRKYGEALPLDCHTVKYEDFVGDPEAEARALVDFLGLDWRDGMADHTAQAKRRARIATVSYDQVVRPIYGRAQDRWKRYRDEIGTSLDDAREFVEAFGY
jgi:tetratricopeptide (TPR) repeat protein